MKIIKLHKCTIEDIRQLVKTDDELLFEAECEFDPELLKELDKHTGKNIVLTLKVNEKIPVEWLRFIPSIRRLAILPYYEYRLDSLEALSVLTSPVDLVFGIYVKHNASFDPIMHIDSLRLFDFGDQGLEHKTQYQFISRQQQLEKLYVKRLDFAILDAIASLRELNVYRTMKNEELIAEKFPHIKKFYLHADSRRKDFSFLQRLTEAEDISVNYNSHLTSFPKMASPEKVKSICMLNCPNFSDADSLLPFVNLERLCLTSHDKPLKLSLNDFKRLKQLNSLKTVYTAWGRGGIPAEVKKIYNETGWKNTMVT